MGVHRACRQADEIDFPAAHQCLNNANSFSGFAHHGSPAFLQGSLRSDGSDTPPPQPQQQPQPQQPQGRGLLARVGDRVLDPRLSFATGFGAPSPAPARLPCQARAASGEAGNGPSVTLHGSNIVTATLGRRLSKEILGAGLMGALAGVRTSGARRAAPAAPPKISTPAAAGDTVTATLGRRLSKEILGAGLLGALAGVGTSGARRAAPAAPHKVDLQGSVPKGHAARKKMPCNKRSKESATEGHCLKPLLTHTAKFNCDRCDPEGKRRLPKGTDMRGCRDCDYDVCIACWDHVNAALHAGVAVA